MGPKAVSPLHTSACGYNILVSMVVFIWQFHQVITMKTMLKILNQEETLNMYIIFIHVHIVDVVGMY